MPGPSLVEDNRTASDHTKSVDTVATVRQDGSTASPVVRLPTQTSPVYEQVVRGRVSPITPDIEEFRGVPYGYVSKRWEHSVVRQSLPEDDFDASQHGPKCPQSAAPNNSDVFQAQMVFSEVGESEFDCLNLWILRPSRSSLVRAGLDPDSKLPVYMYIHGGGFGFGAGTDPFWDPTRMIANSVKQQKPFIAVLINYRLNLFGFAASSSMLESQQDDALEGLNFGIRDQRTALEWIHQNIPAFGGNPDNITIGGQSAGGCSVHVHILDAQNSMRKPLFRRAIIQSGAFTCIGLGPISLKDAEKQWSDLCQHLGVNTESPEASLEKLRHVSAKDLITATEKMGKVVFSLVEDNVTISPISHTQWRIDLGNRTDVETEKQPSETIEVMIGDTDAEGSVFVMRSVPNIKEYAQIFELFNGRFAEQDAKEVLQAYGISDNIDRGDMLQRLVDFASDTAFGVAVYLAYTGLPKPTAPSSGHTIRTHPYRVQFGNPFQGPLKRDAHHCVDLLYIYGAFEEYLKAEDNHETGAVVSNMALSQAMQLDWINFIVGLTELNAQDQVVVYGKDRSKTVKSLTQDSEWIERRKRFEIILKHRPEAGMVLGKLLAGWP